MYSNTKTSICAGFIILSFIFVPPVLADLYQWQDEKGNIHVVDDILLVPPKYKDKVKVMKTKPSQQAPSSQQDAGTPAQAPSLPEQEDIYGDYPLSWWKAEFDARKTEIAEIEKTIAEEEGYIADHERGRRLYKLYSKEDVEKYEMYKKNLPDNKNQINKLKANLEELRHKARIYGVPRQVRE